LHHIRYGTHGLAPDDECRKYVIALLALGAHDDEISRIAPSWIVDDRALKRKARRFDPTTGNLGILFALTDQEREQHRILQIRPDPKSITWAQVQRRNDVKKLMRQKQKWNALTVKVNEAFEPREAAVLNEARKLDRRRADITVNAIIKNILKSGARSVLPAKSTSHHRAVNLSTGCKSLVCSGKSPKRTGSRPMDGGMKRRFVWLNRPRF
jgi:hypothetical protein